MTKALSLKTIPADLISGVVVFLVALPLCLGIAFASCGKEHLFAGIVSGVIGGIVVGALSKSHTSISGTSASLTTILAGAMATLGSFEALLLAIFLAGVIQVGMGLAKAGFIAAFFPTSVIKGLLAAIGVILFLKQLPHFFGHDADAEGEMSFFQPDQRNTFSELLGILPNFHWGAALIGVLSIVILLSWDRIGFLKKSIVPAPLIVVLMGIGMQIWMAGWSSPWPIGTSHLVQVPIAQSISGFTQFFHQPDYSQLYNPAVYKIAIVIALVASLETLLNLKAVDKLDPQQRHSPPNRELLAQGVGNIFCGLLGGMPVTSVIVRSSVGIESGGKTRLTTIFHGILLLGSVAFFPTVLNLIPLSCLAAILIVVGAKLASPQLILKSWNDGWYQFLPFAVTVIAIVFTDLLTGVLIGLGVALGFILHSNLRRPLRRVVEKHPSGDVLRIELANQVSFLNRAALESIFENVPAGGRVLLDARRTDYIDPDVVDLIQTFKGETAPTREISVSLRGFKDHYDMQDSIEYIDYCDQEVQARLTPLQVMRVLQDGNARFRAGQHLTRDFRKQVDATASGQFPLAVVLSCIDSRAPAELIFDTGLGDIFSARVAGNLVTSRVLGSIEYGCAVAGSKLVLVMGHTRCGAVAAAVDLLRQGKTALEVTGCENLDAVVAEIQKSVDASALKQFADWPDHEQAKFLNDVIRLNVIHTLKNIRKDSPTLHRLDQEGKIKLVGGVYDVTSGEMSFLDVHGTLRANSVVAAPAAV